MYKKHIVQNIVPEYYVCTSTSLYLKFAFKIILYLKNRFQLHNWTSLLKFKWTFTIKQISKIEFD